MKFTLETDNIARVERAISPPMRNAITIPLVAESGARGMDVVIYVCTTAFGSIRGVQTSDRELQAIAAEIAARLGER
jgi:hypothetical protein